MQSPDFLKAIIPIVTSQPSLHTKKNSVYNLGFSVKAFPGQDPVVSFTKQGMKTLFGYKQEGEQNSAAIEFAKDMMSGQTATTQHKTEQDNRYPHPLTHSFSSQKNRSTTTSFLSNQNIATGRQNKTHGNTSEGTAMDQGMTRHQRIENNYYNDKRMLARSSSESLLGKTPLNKKTKRTDEENVVKQMSDDLVEEMKNKAREEGL